jgi:hypothetical protein
LPRNAAKDKVTSLDSQKPAIDEFDAFVVDSRTQFVRKVRAGKTLRARADTMAGLSEPAE